MAGGALSVKEVMFGDLERELTVTRRVLERVPVEKFDWTPHEKSMSLGKLAIHVATLPEWAKDALATDVLDFATAPRPPARVGSLAELLDLFDTRAAALREAVAAFDPAKWNDTWTIKNGAEVFTAQPRSKVYRVWCLNHLVHHRGQLNLYLRLLNEPVATVYFNSADDPRWMFE